MFFAEIIFWPIAGIVTEYASWTPVMQFSATFAADGATVGHIRHDDRERFDLVFGKFGSD